MNAAVDLDYQLAIVDERIPFYGVPDAYNIECWVVKALENSGYCGEAQITVRVVEEEEIQSLNSQFRQKDKPTNVLSFPFETPRGMPAALPVLGDIVVCAPVVKHEAQQQTKSEQQHWAHMVIHGTLHLLGYDHNNDADADEMEALEVLTLSEFGFPDPYIQTGNL